MVQTVGSLASFLESPHVRNYIDLINARLDEVAGEQSHGIQVAARYALAGGGKRIRPLLAVLACEAVCGDPRPAIPVAVAYELAHTASFIQDDIIDRSDRRRGQPSVWALWGVEGGILVSDLLIFEIFGLLTEYERLNLPPRALYRLLELIRDSAKDAAVGEFLDVALRKKRTVTVEDYLEMVRLKTGALLAASAAAGAIVGGASTEQVEAIYDFAERIGCAYQIQDDVLDVMDDEGKTGEASFMDPNGKGNIVVVHALMNGSRSETAFLKGLLRRRVISRDEAGQARAIFRRLGSAVYARGLADRLAEEGRALLSSLRPSRAKDALVQLSYLAVRRYA
ncbi:MAG: polyprenyl synthetase family protein [Candidatus Bathyarchaeia archaeon]